MSQFFPPSEIARVVHEANRAMQALLAEEVSPPWDEAPEWMRDSTRAGVVAAIAGTTPEQSHIAWMEERLRAGWQLGYPKDIEAKISPNLVAYDQLAPTQQAKDRLLIAIVGVLATPE